MAGCEAVAVPVDGEGFDIEEGVRRRCYARAAYVMPSHQYPLRGLGDLAVRYGYERFDTEVMLATAAMLVVLVQSIQMLGDRWVRRLARRR